MGSFNPVFQIFNGSHDRLKDRLWLGGTAILWSTLALATPPALASRISNSSPRDYRHCAEDLLDLKLDSEAIAVACAGALRPREISDCAVDIHASTGIEAMDILDACRHVRRPAELGKCVEDIKKAIPETDNTLVLETCRHSLLPQQLADCAVGLQEHLTLAHEEILATCLRGDNYLYEFSITK
jgi:hypothetical protein